MTYPDSYRRLKGAIDHADGGEDFDANILFETHTRDLGDQISERVKSHGDVAVSFVGQAEVGKVFYRPRHPSAAIAPMAWLQK